MEAESPASSRKQIRIDTMAWRPPSPPPPGGGAGDNFFGLEGHVELARQIESKARTALMRRSNSGQLPNPSESPQGRTPAAGDPDSEVERLQKQNEALEMQLIELRVSGSMSTDEHAAENERLRAENRRLTDELARVSRLHSTVEDHSEGRLRACLTRQGTTTSELRQAIRGVESLMDEARRELGNALLRERRAAFEGLHAAIERGAEDALEESIEKARLADVEIEDIAKGEAKLAELRALTPEQRAAKSARELESKSKKEAFELIKKDNPEALQALLDSLGEDVRWQNWRDYAGRSLWKKALELRASRTQSFLGPLLGMKVPEEAKPGKRASVASDAPPQRQNSGGRPSNGSVEFTPPASPEKAEEAPVLQITPPSPVMATPPVHSDAGRADASVPGRPSVLNLGGDESAASEGLSPISRSPLVEGDAATAELRAKAMRAVAQDDCVALAEVLEAVHQDVWTSWHNKAGKDLLTLSMERGSSLAYSMLARQLGMLKELTREAFEERESVWVFEAGEVQPKRATILEDTPAEAEEILVEFWDGDEPPERVERCLVRKMWS